MEFELIVNPQKSKHYPDRYKAVLLLDGGLCKMYPHDMDLEKILEKVSMMAEAFSDGLIKLTYNEK